MTSSSDCAYVIANRASGPRGLLGQSAEQARADLFGPTSMPYPIPGDEERWYQLFEHGVVINSADGSAAYDIFQEGWQPIKARWKEELLDGQVPEKNLYPTSDVPGNTGHRVALFAGIDGLVSAAVVSPNRASDHAAYLVEGSVLAKYDDYDPAVTNPDRFRGYLGSPLNDQQCGDSTCTWSHQAFENGIIVVADNQTTVAPSHPQACNHCDNDPQTAPDLVCQGEETASDCADTPGCTWNATHSVCIANTVSTCSANPSDFVCPPLSQSACEQTTGCTWHAGARECWSTAPTGAIGQQIAERGWFISSCSYPLNDDSKGYYQDCWHDGLQHRVYWGMQTQCAHVLWSGTDARSKLREKYEGPITAWAPGVRYRAGQCRQSGGRLYVCETAGTSAATGNGPTGSNPNVIVTDGSAAWRFVSTKPTHGAILGAPTSEAQAIGTGHWVQYFEHGALLFTDGRTSAVRIGDSSAAGLALKQRFQQAHWSGELLASGRLPIRDTIVLATGGRRVDLASGGYLMSNVGSAYRIVEEVYDQFVDYDDGQEESGFLGHPISELVAESGYKYQLFEGGIVTNFGGTWRAVPSYGPAGLYWNDDEGGDLRQPFCLQSNERALAMEMRRLNQGWGAWTGAEVVHQGYDHPVGYHRPTTNGIVVYNHASERGGIPVLCAFSLPTGPLTNAWLAYSYESRADYGFPTSEVVYVKGPNGADKGEYIYLQYGVLAHQAGENDAVTLGSRDPLVARSLGLALKHRFRLQHDAAPLTSGDHFPLPSQDGWPICYHLGQQIVQYANGDFIVAACNWFQDQTACDTTSGCAWSAHESQCLPIAYEVTGGAASTYDANGACSGFLREPTSDRLCANADCSAVYQNFSGGALKRPTGGSWSATSSQIEFCTDVCTTQTSCAQTCHNTDLEVISCSQFGACTTCSDSLCPADPEGTDTLYSARFLVCQHDGTTKDCLTYRRDAHDDADADGIPDTLEKELAESVAPRLVLAPRDLAQFYGGSEAASRCPDSDPECQIPYVVRAFKGSSDTLECEEDFQCLEIHYSLLYNYDLGKKFKREGFLFDPIVGLALSQVTVKDHRGDTEHYGVLVARKEPVRGSPEWENSWSTAKNDPDAWKVVGRISSAHRCAGVTDSTRYAFWRRSRPMTATGPSKMDVSASEHRADPFLLFVAKRKHASFFTKTSCGNGALHTDSCVRARPRTLHTINPDNLTNAGEFNRSALFDGEVNFPGRKPNRRAGGVHGLYAIWERTRTFGGGSGDGRPMFDVLHAGSNRWDAATYFCP